MPLTLRSSKTSALTYDEVDGNFTWLQAGNWIDGTPANPAAFFQNDTDTGIYRVASNEFGIATGGALRLRASSSGVEVTGNATVSGSVNATGAVTGSTALISGNATVGSVNSGPIAGFRNRIINGNMRFCQRHASNVITFNTNSTAYVLDRWLVARTGTMNFQVTRGVTLSHALLSNSLRAHQLDITSTQSSLGANDVLSVTQRIEGYNVADFLFGTADAKAFTLSFMVNSNATGTYSVSFRNQATNRCYVATYTINLPNTWERKTISLTADTTGTWLVDNTIGLQVTFAFAAGSALSTSTVNTWQAGNFVASSGTTNFANIASGRIRITDVQLELGSAATPFEQRPFQMELDLCQRYYEKSYEWDTVPSTATTTNCEFSWCSPANVDRPYNFFSKFRIEKVSLPSSALIYSPITGQVGTARDQIANVDRVATLTATGACIALPAWTGGVSNNQMAWHWVVSAEL